MSDEYIEKEEPVIVDEKEPMESRDEDSGEEKAVE